jgi:hypothetical protein
MALTHALKLILAIGRSAVAINETPGRSRKAEKEVLLSMSIHEELVL